MKRKSAIILASVLSAVFALGACGKFPAVSVSGQPDASFAVIGNGGMSVQQDKYVYFVNGYSTADMTATNEWGDAVRGGIYRLELADTQAAATQVVTATADASKFETAGYTVDPYQGYYGSYKTRLAADVTPVKDGADSVTAFRMHNVKNYDDENVAQVEAKCIVPKKVIDGNGDVKGGGLYIFDGWIYYASPVTEKNSTGEIMYDRVDFFRTRLNGKDTELIYKSSDVDTKPNYGYYYYNGKTYLMVLDDGKLYGFACTDKGVNSVAKNKGKTAPIATGVTGIVFAEKPVWYKGMAAATAEDYIYYTRAVDTDDNEPNGNVVERVRPDGTEKREISNDGNTVTLNKLVGGYLYYTEQNTLGNSKLVAKELTTGETKDLVDMANISDLYVGNEISTFDATTGKVAVGHYVFATQNGDFVRITDAGTTTLATGVTAQVQFVDNGYVYYFTQAASTDTPYVRLWRVSLAGGDAVECTDNNALFAPASYFAPEITAGYLFYVSDVVETVMVEDTATESPKTTNAGYVMIKRAASNDNEPEFFAGVLQGDDIPEADEEEEE